MKLIHRTYPPLKKYCDEKYNIATGCNTLRLGTLFGYRSEENEHLRDEGEGTFKVTVNFPTKREVPIEWANHIVGSARSGFEADMSIDNNSDLPGGMSFKTSRIEVENSTYNSWIFCMSNSETANAGAITHTYDSCWSIDGDPSVIQTFANKLLSLLQASISINDLPAHIFAQDSIYDIHRHLELRCEVQSVEYTDRILNITEDDEMTTKSLDFLFNRFAFVKPKSFSEEQEVRFLFSVFYKGQQVSVPDVPKILFLSPISKLVRNGAPAPF